MYGQSNIGGLTRFAVTLVIIGFLLCLGLINSDVVNPIRSLSAYQREQVEINQMKAQATIEAEVAEELKKERLKAEQEKLQAEQQHQIEMQQLEREQMRLQNQQLQEAIEAQRQRHQAELEHQRQVQAAELAAQRKRLETYNQLLAIAGEAAIVVISILIIALGVTACYIIATRSVQHRRIEVEQRRRKEMIQAARRREREARRQALEAQRQMTRRTLLRGGNGRQHENQVITNQAEDFPLTPEEYNDLPLAS